jgi:hypothetical protein
VFNKATCAILLASFMGRLRARNASSSLIQGELLFSFTSLNMQDAASNRNLSLFWSILTLLRLVFSAFVIKLSHKWLPVGVRERRCGAATDTCLKCIQPETVPHLYLCHSRTTSRDQFIAQLAKHLKDATTAADLRCTIVNGIQQWILTDTRCKVDGRAIRRAWK